MGLKKTFYHSDFSEKHRLKPVLKTQKVWNNNNNNNNNNNVAGHRIKQKEYEKKDKYLDLTRELKKMWNMQVTIIPIVIGAFGTVTKGLLKGLVDL